MKFILEVQLLDGETDTIERMAEVVAGVAETLDTFGRLTGGQHDLRKPMCRCGKCENARMFIAEMQENVTKKVTLRMKVVDEDVDPVPEVQQTDPGFVFDPEEGVSYRSRMNDENPEVLQ